MGSSSCKVDCGHSQYGCCSKSTRVAGNSTVFLNRSRQGYEVPQVQDSTHGNSLHEEVIAPDCLQQAAQHLQSGQDEETDAAKEAANGQDQPSARDGGNVSPVGVEVAIVEEQPDGVGEEGLKVQRAVQPSTGVADDASTSVSASPETSSSKLAWQRAVKKALLLNNASGKVPMQNKIGTKLEGWYRDVALALQKGIADHGRRASLTYDEPPSNGFYAPAEELFRRARVACGFSAARYYATMGLQEGLMEPSLALVGSSAAAGKSGAFFFLSPDQQLIAKSCTDEDWRTLLQILHHYVHYVENARHRADARIRSGSMATDTSVRGFIETLLPRYLGLYKVTVGDDPKPVLVVVMANIFSGALSIDRRYDLKGSTHGRKSSKKERAKKTPVFKDLDWCADEASLVISTMGRGMLLETIRSDVDFLASMRLMDYSLLIGVHEIGDEPPPLEVMNIVSVRDSTRHCYLGIIDVLTPYRLRKRAETFLLGRLFCGRDISCQHPQVYARRFHSFVDTRVFASM